MDFYHDYDSEPELRRVEVRLLGTGAAVATKVYGQGITVARTGAGVHTLTFAESPGTYAGVVWGLDATTPAGVAGWTVVATATSAMVITVTTYNSLFAAADLSAAQWANLTIRFKQASV